LKVYPVIGGRWDGAWQPEPENGNERRIHLYDEKRTGDLAVWYQWCDEGHWHYEKDGSCNELCPGSRRIIPCPLIRQFAAGVDDFLARLTA